jgi:hypothetical protein
MSRETDLAWVAGIIDGEGTMGLYHTKTGAQWKFQLAVANTDLRILSRVRDTVGAGRIALHRVGRTGRPCYAWLLSSTAAAKALTEVLPYLVGKRDQALLMLEARTYTQRAGQHHAQFHGPHPHRARLMEIEKVLRAMKRQTAEAPVVATSPKKPTVRQLMLVPDVSA